MKYTASVTKSLHQDHSPCYWHLAMFFWWWIVLFWPTKGVQPYFLLGPWSKILTITNLQHAASRIWTCTEPEFRLHWMRLCSGDNYFTLILSHKFFHITLLFCSKKKSCCDHCFPKKIRPQTTIQLHMLQDFTSKRISFNRNRKCHLLPIVYTMLV